MLRPLFAVTFVWALVMPSVPASAADTVPFHAVINTVPAVVGPCGPTCLALEITGLGQATHLGRTHVDGPSQVDVVSATQTGTSTLMEASMLDMASPPVAGSWAARMLATAHGEWP